MEIDHRRSNVLPERLQVAQAVIAIVSQYMPPETNREEFIPTNITLKEVSRHTGIAPNKIADSLRHTVMHRGVEHELPGLHVTDTRGDEWIIVEGRKGNRQPKEAARVAGRKKYGAENRIRQSIEAHNMRHNTRIDVFRKYY